MNAPRIVDREVPEETYRRLTAAGNSAVLARVYAARGVHSTDDLDTSLGKLLPNTDLLGCREMAGILADAIVAGKRLLIVADYDADGATACAVGVIALQSLGARVEYLVPNRFEYGYGLTPEIVRLAAARSPDLLITVDNGIASVDGVAEAAGLGMQVLITDHHLPGPELPAAACIVNPNQAGCEFASKHLAGVGVMFYVITALRTELRARGHFLSQPEPNLGELLDLVALGTVADVVRLDRNNRILVEKGLARIRAGRARPGIAALFRVAGRDAARASTYDLGFVLGPRLNAAGRLTDMSLGIECLLSQSAERADDLAAQLDALNKERREIESGMQDSALASLNAVQGNDNWSLCLFDASWHQGVIGILAARLRERFHRPAIAFAPSDRDEAKGSGRSIRGLHLRDALDRVAKLNPGLILKYGGHAAAAGLTIRQSDMAAFAAAFEQAVRSLIGPAELEQVIETDGPLAEADLTLPLAESLACQVWGQGFAEPLFYGRYDVMEQRIVGGRHLKLRLRARSGESVFDAILFGQSAPLPETLLAVFRLQINEFRGNRSLQLVVDHWRPV